MKQGHYISVFLDQIMKIEVQRMAGASAGILGQAGMDNDIVISLKRATITLATEYRKSTPNNSYRKFRVGFGASVRL